MGSFKPITARYLTMIIKPRNFAKRQCKLQWLTPPPNSANLVTLATSAPVLHMQLATEAGRFGPTLSHSAGEVLRDGRDHPLDRGARAK